MHHTVDSGPPKMKAAGRAGPSRLEVKANQSRIYQPNYTRTTTISKRLPPFGKSLIARRLATDPPLRVVVKYSKDWGGADLAINPRNWVRDHYDWRVLADLHVTLVAETEEPSLHELLGEIAEFAGVIFVQIAGRTYEAGELASLRQTHGDQLGEWIYPSWYPAGLYARRLLRWISTQEARHAR